MKPPFSLLALCVGCTAGGLVIAHLDGLAVMFALFSINLAIHKAP